MRRLLVFVVLGGLGCLDFDSKLGAGVCIDGGIYVSCDAGVSVESPDGGPPDAGTLDSGPPDAGTSDAGTLDAGTPDAGISDAGPPDAAVQDSGFRDSGVTAQNCLNLNTPDAGRWIQEWPVFPDAGLDTVPTTLAIYSIWGRDDTDVCVGGAAGLLMRWNGQRWIDYSNVVRSIPLAQQNDPEPVVLGSALHENEWYFAIRGLGLVKESNGTLAVAQSMTDIKGVVHYGTELLILRENNAILTDLNESPLFSRAGATGYGVWVVGHECYLSYYNPSGSADGGARNEVRSCGANQQAAGESFPGNPTIYSASAGLDGGLVFPSGSLGGGFIRVDGGWESSSFGLDQSLTAFTIADCKPFQNSLVCAGFNGKLGNAQRNYSTGDTYSHFRQIWVSSDGGQLIAVGEDGLSALVTSFSPSASPFAGRTNRLSLISSSSQSIFSVVGAGGIILRKDPNSSGYSRKIAPNQQLVGVAVNPDNTNHSIVAYAGPNGTIDVARVINPNTPTYAQIFSLGEAARFKEYEVPMLQIGQDVYFGGTSLHRISFDGGNRDLGLPTPYPDAGISSVLSIEYENSQLYFSLMTDNTDVEKRTISRWRYLPDGGHSLLARIDNVGQQLMSSSPTLFAVTTDGGLLFDYPLISNETPLGGIRRWNFTSTVSDELMDSFPLIALSKVGDGSIWAADEYGKVFRRNTETESWERIRVPTAASADYRLSKHLLHFGSFDGGTYVFGPNETILRLNQ